MSKHHHDTIVCPVCKKESDFIIWDSVNTEINPELKEKVISGTLFEWNCPSCGHKATIDYQILYHEMEKQAMVYYVPEDPQNAIKELNEIFDDIEKEFSLGQDYQIRVVSSQNQLREKAMILESSLDDRVIEIMKAFMIAYMSDNDSVSEILFEETANGEKRFAVRNNKDQWGVVSFNEGLYKKVFDLFKPRLESKESNEYIVDLDWAIKTIKDDQN